MTDDVEDSFPFDAIYDGAAQAQYYQEKCYNVVKRVTEGDSGALIFCGIPEAPVQTVVVGSPNTTGERYGILQRAIDQFLGSAVNQMSAQPDLTVTINLSCLMCNESAVHDLLVADSSALRTVEGDQGVYVNASTARVMNPVQLSKVIERYDVVRELKAERIPPNDAHIIWTLEYHLQDGDDTRITKLCIAMLANWTAAHGLSSESKNAPTAFSTIAAVMQGLAKNQAGKSVKTSRRTQLEGKLVESPGLPAVPTAQGTIPFHVPYRDSKLTHLMKDCLESMNVVITAVLNTGVVGGDGRNRPTQIAAQIAEKRRYEQVKRTHALLKYVARVRDGMSPDRIGVSQLGVNHSAMGVNHSAMGNQNGMGVNRSRLTVPHQIPTTPDRPARTSFRQPSTPTPAPGQPHTRVMITEEYGQDTRNLQALATSTAPRPQTQAQDMYRSPRRANPGTPAAMTGEQAQAHAEAENRIDELEVDNKLLADKLATAEQKLAEVDGYWTELEALKLRAETAEASLREARTHATSTTTRTGECETALQRAHAEMQALSEEADAARRKEAATTDQLQQLKLEKEIGDNRLAKTQAEAAEIEGRLADKIAAEARLSDQVAGLREELMGLDARHKRLEQDHAQITASHESLTGAFQDLNDKHAGAMADLEATRGSAAQLDGMLNRARTETAELTEARQQLDMNLSAETQLRTKVQRDLEAALDDAENLNARISELEGLQAAADKAMSKMKGRVREAGARAVESDEVAKRLRKHTGKVERQLEETRTATANLTAQLESARAKLDDAQGRAGTLEHELLQANGKLTQLTRQQKDSADRASRATTTIDSLSARVAKQQNDLMDAGTDLRRLRDSCDDLTAKATAKEATAANLQQRIRDMEREIDGLRDERNTQTKRIAELETATQMVRRSGQGQGPTDTIYQSFPPSEYTPRPATQWGTYNTQSHAGQGETRTYQHYDLPARQSYQHQAQTQPMPQQSAGPGAPMSKHDLEAGSRMYQTYSAGGTSAAAPHTSVNVVRTESPTRREIQLTMSEMPPRMDGHDMSRM